MQIDRAGSILTAWRWSTTSSRWEPSLDRSYVVTVRGRLKFRVGSIVYTAFSQDESVMGFAFPKEERAALVDSDPRFHLPSEADMRFNWVHATARRPRPGRGP